MRGLAGKVCIVTGGGRGSGAATAGNLPHAANTEAGRRDNHGG
jgi:NAD(P)-dependent dehydrogenase (short-subunit alcohol dehydrogenase family)